MTSMIVMEIVSGGQRDRHHRAQREAGPQERDRRQDVAEDEGQADGQRDRRDVAPAERRGDDQADGLAEDAAGHAVQGRRRRQAVEALVGVAEVGRWSCVRRHEVIPLRMSRPTAAMSSSVLSARSSPCAPRTQ
jgi:hypothetical protein